MKIRYIVIPLVLMMLIIGGIFYFNRSGDLPFSIISPPTSVELKGSKLFWLTTLSVDSENEELTARYIVDDNVRKQELPNGDVVEPQESFSVSFSVDSNRCEYSLQATEYRNILTNLKYYAVSGTPERRIDYKVSNSKTDEEKVFSAFDESQKIFSDNDGKGQIIVKSLGSLQGLRDCSQQQVWMCVDDNNELRFIDPTTIEGLLVTGNDARVCRIYAEEFPSNFIVGFDNGYLEGQSRFIGVMPDNSIGTAVVSVSADQDFFDSIVYTPAEVVDPKITDITFSRLVTGKTGTMKVRVENRADNFGNVQLKVSSEGLGFTPSQKTITLDTLKEVFFTVTTPFVSAEDVEVCVVASSTGNQFEAGKTDEDCVKVDISDDGTVSCGNSICEPELGETSSTCNVDCPIIQECTRIPNSEYSDETKSCVCKDGFTLREEDGDFVCKKPNIGIIIEIIIVGIVAIGMMTAFYLKNNKPKRRRK
ncbi:MAG: hypothetical protein ACE5RP_00180 [Nitrosopumilus sp.]